MNLRQLTRFSNAGKYRLTLDTWEDFELLKILIEKYGAGILSGDEIIKLMELHPELVLINQHVEQKKN